MHMAHNRTIKLNKAKLIEKIEENKQKHIKDYEEAVIAYRKKAQELLDKTIKELSDGSLKIGITLVTPVNRANEYDKVIEMFNWELNDEVELTQSEFNEYIHDDNSASRASYLTNSTYK